VGHRSWPEVKHWQGPATEGRVRRQLAGYSERTGWAGGEALGGWADYWVEDQACQDVCPELWVVWSGGPGEIYFATAGRTSKKQRDRAWDMYESTRGLSAHALDPRRRVNPPPLPSNAPEDVERPEPPEVHGGPPLDPIPAPVPVLGPVPVRRRPT
jgi:hypothetical protein